MSLPLLLLFAGIVTTVVALNVLASAVLIKARYVQRGQLVAQLVFTWAFPVVGALLVLHFLRENEPQPRVEPWSPPERINQNLEEVLKVQARGATRAARQEIENTIIEHSSSSETSGNGGGSD